MITKQCQFVGRDDRGEYIHVLRAGYDNDQLVKTAAASPPQLARIQSFMKDRPRSSKKLHTLVSALGAGEYWGSNSNADWFGEEALLHTPPGWDRFPYDQQKLVGARWEWGYPTFYNAHAFAHHQNKDPNRAFGDIEFVMWDPSMKRVLLIVSFDRNRAREFGAVGVLDRVENGEYPSVSMGCFPAGTPIFMADGSESAIEAVQVGDRVKTHRGQDGRVAQVHRRRYAGTMYDIKVHGHRRRLRLTDEHPLLVVGEDQLRCRPHVSGHNRGRRMRQCTPITKDFSKGCVGCETTPQFEPTWVRADELQVGDRMLFPVPEHVDGTLDNPLLLELLGYYLAEGFVHKYNERECAAVTFCLSLDETALRDRIIELGQQFGIAAHSSWEVPARGGMYVSLLGCEDLAALCARHCGSGAKSKQLSSEIVHAAPELQKNFLGAYWKGDGGYYTGDTCTGLYFSTASEALADQLFVILARCGIISSVNRIAHTPSSKSVVRIDTVEFQVWIGKQFVEVLAGHCGVSAPELKAIKPLRFFFEHRGTRYIASPVEEILGEAYDDEVCNFAVDGDDSYIAAHLAVHNCRVPFDCCSVCFDREKYQHLMGTPRKIVALHKQNPITGLSTATSQYCQHLQRELNKIYPDGRKTRMLNIHPRFFDLSVVFIGADKTSFILAKLGGECPIQPGHKACSGCSHTDCVSSAHVHEVWSRGVEKTAEAASRPKTTKQRGYADRLRAALKRPRAAKEKTGSIPKDAEIIKRVASNFRKNMPKILDKEPLIPTDVQDKMSENPRDSLRTAGSMGIIARPREFQRIMIRHMGRPALADDLDRRGMVFRTGGAPSGFRLGGSILPKILEALLPLMGGRSVLRPALERRTVIIIKKSDPSSRTSEMCLDDPFLDKLSSDYSAYRRDLLYKAPGLIKEAVYTHPKVTAELYGDQILDPGLVKVGGDVMESMVGMLSSIYLNEAYLDEPVSKFVEQHNNLAGLEKASGLAMLGGVA